MGEPDDDDALAAMHAIAMHDLGTAVAIAFAVGVVVGVALTALLGLV